MPKKKYFTKCNRKFFKASTAEVTGYKLDLEDPEYEECKTCPFKIEVKKGWPEVFDHWECRAGSEYPNQENNWRGNSDDKTGINVMSLDHEYLTNVIVYCETHDDITGVSYSNDEKDCRRCLSIGFAQNKKGIAAKQKFLKLFFGVEVPEKDTRTRKEKLAALSKACDEQAAKSESKRTHYDKWDKRNNQELTDRYVGQNGCDAESIERLAEWFFVSEDMIREQLKTLNIAEPTLLNSEDSQLKEPEEFTSIPEKMDEDTAMEKLQFLFKAGKALSDLSEIMGKDWTEILKLLREMGEDPGEIESEFIELNQKRTYELSKINKNFQIGISPAMLDDVEWEKVLNNAEKGKENSKEAHAMFNQEFDALLKSVTTKTVAKNVDGQKFKEAVYKIIIETNDIDYESVEKEAPYIHGLITYNEIMQFKSINFGAIPIHDLSLSIRGVNEFGDLVNQAVEISSAKIINLTVVNKVNIPHYFFSIEMPKTIPGRYLLDNLAGIIKVSLNKPAGLFDNISDVKVTIKGV